MYSQLVSWEVWNFMSVAHGKCEFDEKGIINLKGYNDSGKSAMLQALKVLMTNSNPTKQVSFIKDDAGYFRVFATFSDGVQILRDKYSNGQSLYEMYKDAQLIFSTKSGNALTKVSEVPEPIAEYLGLVMWDGSCLNARTCFEKQFGVQTTGSENYKAFNIVLRSEELARAGELLNNDKNKLSGDISSVDAELQAQKTLLGRGVKISDTLINRMEEEDKKLDTFESMESDGSAIKALHDEISGIPVIPLLSSISDDELLKLEQIDGLMAEIATIPKYPLLAEVSDADDILEIASVMSEIASLEIPPELSEVSGVSELAEISGLLAEIRGIGVSPLLTEVEEPAELLGIYTILEEMKNLSAENIEIDVELQGLDEELNNLVEELKAHDVKVIKCPNCGEVFSADDNHSHIEV